MESNPVILLFGNQNSLRLASFPENHGPHMMNFMKGLSFQFGPMQNSLT